MLNFRLPPRKYETFIKNDVLKQPSTTSGLKLNARSIPVKRVSVPLLGTILEESILSPLILHHK